MTKLPKLIAIIEAGKRNVKPAHRKPRLEGAALPEVPKDCIKGTITMMIGPMKMVISSLRRVNAFKSFRIKAASVVEKPSLPSKPVFGA